MSPHKLFKSRLSLLCILCFSCSLHATEYFKNLQGTYSIGPIDGIMIKNSCSKKEAACEGTCEWIDGRVYTGEFKHGQPDGWGRLTWKDGATYEGQFSKGQRHGKGEQTLLNRDRYIGEWVEGFMSGPGDYIWSDGTYYNGEFKNDKMEGNGKISLINGESYIGSWKNGFADGDGTYILIDGTKYMGHFKNGKRHGQGIITWSTGDVLMGTWHKGQINKKSNFKFVNGDSFSTKWKKGQMTNNGIYKIVSDEREIYGDIHTVESETISDEALFESTSPNIALVYYAVSLEFKFNKDFKLAKHYMELAQKYIAPSSDLNKLIHNQLELIDDKMDEM